jgi:2'-5' RNA ligase
MSYHCFLDDAEHITQLDGQRFVVLRPTLDVAKVYGGIKRSVRRRLAGLPVSYPACPHVTLAGFAAGSSLEVVQDLVAAWSCDVPPLHIEIEAVSSFPAPFQIVIAQVRKTSELVSAMGDLRRRSEARRLVVSTRVAPADWIFHMSLAYCAKLSAAEWDDVTGWLPTLPVPAAHGVVTQAEVVALDQSREYSGGVYPFMPHAAAALT